MGFEKRKFLPLEKNTAKENCINSEGASQHYLQLIKLYSSEYYGYRVFLYVYIFLFNQSDLIKFYFAPADFTTMLILKKSTSY